MTAIFYLLLFSFVSRSLTNLTFKAFHQLSFFVGHPVCILYIASQQLSKYMVKNIVIHISYPWIYYLGWTFTFTHSVINGFYFIWNQDFLIYNFQNFSGGVEVDFGLGFLFCKFANFMFIPINWPLKCNSFKKSSLSEFSIYNKF